MGQRIKENNRINVGKINTVTTSTVLHEVDNVSTKSESGINLSSQFDPNRLLLDNYIAINSLKEEVEKIKRTDGKENDFINESAKLAKTANIVLIILIIIPIVQVITFTVIVYALGIQDKLSGLLNLSLNVITGISFLELIVGGIKIYNYDNRIKLVEKEIAAINENISSIGVSRL